MKSGMQNTNNGASPCVWARNIIPKKIAVVPLTLKTHLRPKCDPAKQKKLGGGW